jgi:hypothetical protein
MRSGPNAYLLRKSKNEEISARSVGGSGIYRIGPSG